MAIINILRNRDCEPNEEYSRGRKADRILASDMLNATTDTLPTEADSQMRSALFGRMLSKGAYRTKLGAAYHGLFEECVTSQALAGLEGKVQLIFTSPPFPLNNKKAYDNKQGSEYKAWLRSYAPLFKRLLKPNGSLVIEIGNAWEPELPVMSTLALEALLGLKEEGEFFLCQQFVVNNPARLPSPAQWVTVNRIRVTDSYTNVWWLSSTAFPKADNRRVLRAYSNSMKKLLEKQTYNDGKRPSGHSINATSFLSDHGGSIPHNAIGPKDGIEDSVDEATAPLLWERGNGAFLEISNTRSQDNYLSYCKLNDLEVHPARMQMALPHFFIKFLTDPEDIVLDPFAGSNTTGAAAELLGRRWLAFEPNLNYLKGSIGRFEGNGCTVHSDISKGVSSSSE